MSKKSHGKKENKETQSPVFKVFRDIIQKERTDPEKATLLKEKQKDKKRKMYSGHRKSDKSYDSSSTDRYKKKNKFTVQGVQEERNEYIPADVKEAWWAQEKRSKKGNDTCSCVSCALKKVLSSEYTCMACLLVLFSASVVGAFMFVFKSSPILDSKPEGSQLMKRHSDRGMKRPWDVRNNVASYVGVYGTDFGDMKLQIPNTLEGMEGISEDLASVLDTNKISETRENNRIRDFYKKLLQTDAKIKKLKESLFNTYSTDTKQNAFERFKRSIHQKSKLKPNYDNYKVQNTIYNNTKEKSVNKLKSTKKHLNLDNNTLVTSGIIIKEEKFFIKYGPMGRRNYPKCYHPHAENHHDRKLNHPFYKISQRFDEMLNKYMSSDKSNKTKESKLMKNNKTKHNDVRTHFKDSIKPYTLDINTDNNITDGTFNYFYNSNHYLTESTLTQGGDVGYNRNFEDIKANKFTKERFSRKLLQVDEDDENLGYEDLKEVWSDDQQTHDEMDSHPERVKRDNANVNQKYNFPSGIHNPNWKGPMPLYPDEINAIIKQAALQNLNIHIPDSKENKNEKERPERDISDTEYLEDYLDSKYNNLIGLAQAYSDYGVLDEKFDINESTKGTEKPEEKFKSFEKEKFKKDVFGRTKKDWAMPSEGLKFEYRPSPSESALFKMLGRHVKLLKPNENNLKSGVYTPSQSHQNALETTEKSKDKHKFNIGRRTLKSLDPDSNDILEEIPDSYLLTEEELTTKKEENNLLLKLKGPNINKEVIIAKPKTQDYKHVYKFRVPIRSVKSIDDKLESNISGGNNESMGVGEFLSLLSDWFMTMAEAAGEFQRKGIINNRTASENEHSVKTETAIDVKNNEDEKLKIIPFKSRQLKTFEEHSTVSNSSDTIKREDKTKDVKDQAHTENATKTTFSTIANETKKDDKNKTVIKRSIENNNFIFWNHIYDEDEYGTKMDYFNMRVKHSPKYDYKGAFVKSKDWMQDKMRMVSDRVKDELQKGINYLNTKTTTRKVSSNIPKKSQYYRAARSIDINDDFDVAKSFAELNANLKHVCRQAAEAVRNTRKIETREDSEEAQATGLMQQLVQLMSDLVNIQVQQKTCAKLPADLRDFLEWLVVPDTPTVSDVDSISEYKHIFGDEDRFGKSTDLYDLSLTEDTHQDDRTECLGTIRAVQDLIQQYEGMSDDDKSKMSGVKEYLENQLDFLNKKLNTLKENETYNFMKRETRLKRQVQHPRLKRLFNRYMNYARKHTKTTIPKITKAKIAGSMKNTKKKDMDKEERSSRNIKDIYFKAVEEARKTTVKKN